MVKSMTGYGRTHKSVCGRSITVEIKSVNHRYLDCSVKSPRFYGFVEDALRSLVQGAITRGKVEVYIQIEQLNSDDISVELNTKLAGAYVEALNRLAAEFSLKGEITATTVSHMPDVLTTIKQDPDVETIIEAVKEVASLSIEEFNAMRLREGENLAADVLSRASAIEALVEKIEAYSPKSVEAYAERLESRIREILENREVDETRLLTEVAIFADKTSVTEEIVRLKSHISQLGEMMRSSEPVGRKIDFLIQEINREVNTIGSKSSDIEATKIVVDLKAEIEKVREQIQNIE